MLSDLLRSYREGDADVQVAVLDEFEPLLFGYMRSLMPSGPDAFERAVEATHALVLGFHLRALAGGLDIADVAALKRLAHTMAVRKLADRGDVHLQPLADEETGSMVRTVADVGRRVANELDETERSLLATKLLGEDGEGDWDGVRERLVRCGILR